MTFKIVCMGICVNGDCDCMVHNFETVKEDTKLPPYHEGCVCIAVEDPQQHGNVIIHGKEKCL